MLENYHERYEVAIRCWISGMVFIEYEQFPGPSAA
jgi:hypothetical protein